MTVAVAMIEPQYDVNAGHVARVMKNFGFYDLYLVSPKFNREEAVRFSTHGKDILESSKTVSISELRDKFDVLVGTTALGASSKLNVTRGAINVTSLSDIINKSEGNRDYCIVLGRESSGLHNKELDLCDLVVIIDTKTDYMTMNISHALAILLYELSKTRTCDNGVKKQTDLASGREIDLLIEYSDKLARICRYDEHKRPLLNSAIRRLMGRSTPTSKEVMLLVSLLRKSMIMIESLKSQKEVRV